MKKAFLLASACCAALLVSTQATAQDSVGDNANEAEASAIIVTAQRREQKAQEVPISLTIFAGKALQDRAISDVSQLGNVTPPRGDGPASTILSHPNALQAHFHART